MTTPLLHIQDLHVRYGGIAALRGLDLTIHAGETVMVTGPNGAGKSTLMKAIAGLVKPRQGRIGVGWRTIASAEQPPADEPSVTIAEVDALLSELARLRPLDPAPAPPTSPAVAPTGR